MQPGEEHDDQRLRAMGRIWSKGTYRLREIMENTGNRVMYHLLGPKGTSHGRNGPESAMAPAPQRAFVSEELMLIPEDTELPPDYVQEL